MEKECRNIGQNISTTDYWLTFTYAFLNTYVEKSVDISETSIVTQNCVYADVKCLEIIECTFPNPCINLASALNI